jgi:FkbM family methyltransferase
MLETLHRVGSKLRNSSALRNQTWLWRRAEPLWNSLFARASSKRGYHTRLNGDEFRLTYESAARYDRSDRGEYEPVFYNAFVKEIGAGMQVLDIGAHVGFFALGAAKRVGAAGHVHVFEPTPETLKILEAHVALNHWNDRVTVFPGVVADKNGEMTFYSHGTSMAASLSRENTVDLNPERPQHAKALSVPAVTLDSYCSERRIRPDVIKIDVEGAELLVLQGGRETLTTHDVTIFCEVHTRHLKNCGGSLEALNDFVDALGYRAEPLDTPNENGTFHCVYRRRA